VRKAFCAGFFMNIAVREPNKRLYKTVTDCIEVRIHPSSVLKDPFPDCILYNQLILTSKNYVRDVCAIDEEWINDVVPKHFSNALYNQASDMLEDTHKAKQLSKENKKKTSGFVVKHSP
jgi:HrpA-like RNA helicase